MNKSNEEVSFKGKLRRVICNKENFKMYAMDINKKDYPDIILTQYDNVLICGDLFELQHDIEYEITAEKSYTKWGYRVKNIAYERPTSKEDIFLFLSEILTHRQAETLFEHYPDIVDIVKENRTDEVDLNKLKGIKEKTFAKIVKKIVDNFCLVDLVSEFQGYLSLSIIKKLYNKYSSIDLLKEKLRQDAYKCLCGISGIGFLKADALLLEIERISNENIAYNKEPIIKFDYYLKTSEQRCKAALIYLLEENENNGHTQMNLASLRSDCMALVPAAIDEFTNAIKDDIFYYNVEDMTVALRKTYNTEYDVASTLCEALKTNIVWDVDVEKYRETSGCCLTDEQLSILSEISKHNVAILNGAGGVGKSSSIRAMIIMLKDLGKSYKLFAPTGKASKVLAEYTNENAMTIHRGLGYIMGGEWTYNADNKLESDVIIVDEFSMVDIFLMSKLVDAIDFKRTKLLIIGDNSQIPSVGSGNVLHDLMHSNIIPTVTLTKVFRYSEGGLYQIATKVRLCEPYLSKSMKNKMTTFGSNEDYTFIDVTSDKIEDNTVALYKKLLSNGKTINDIQVLTAKNVGECGSISLNNKLQKVANPNYNSDTKMVIGKNDTQITYYIGDLIIQKSNNYKAIMCDEDGYELYSDDDFLQEEPLTAFVANGENGVIKDIYAGYIIIDFDGILIKYDKESMLSVRLGYAISIHSSQGSSSNTIVLTTPKSHTFMLDSNLIYVGLTRMREKCYHLGDLGTVNVAVKKKANFTRHTFMQKLLNDLHSNTEVVNLTD